MPVKSKVKISQNFVAFSEYMNFKNLNNIPKQIENYKFLQIQKKLDHNVHFFTQKAVKDEARARMQCAVSPSHTGVR